MGPLVFFFLLPPPPLLTPSPPSPPPAAAAAAADRRVGTGKEAVGGSGAVGGEEDLGMLHAQVVALLDRHSVGGLTAPHPGLEVDHLLLVLQDHDVARVARHAYRKLPLRMVQVVLRVPPPAAVVVDVVRLVLCNARCVCAPPRAPLRDLHMLEVAHQLRLHRTHLPRLEPC